MRINSVPQFPENQQTDATSSVRRNASQTQAEGSNAATDVATLSAGADQVKSLATQLQGLPDVRQEKVQALQKAVQQGTYQVSNHQIADAILSQLAGQWSGKSQ